MDNPSSSFKVGWTRKWKTKNRKGYYIYHFYFCLDFDKWWAIDFKVRGNKRIKPDRLIMRKIRKEQINFRSYQTSSAQMEGWIVMKENRWNEVMDELRKRDQERIDEINKICEKLRGFK